MIVAHEEVLAELVASGPASARELAEALVASVSAIRSRLSDLETRGWVRSEPRSAASGNGRGSVWIATIRGREVDEVNEPF
jgi:predicted ArsR family transcriptional regulator